MITRLYNVTGTDNIGWWPSVHIVPKTIEGLRVLALEALRAGEIRMIDDLELVAVAVLGIEPEKNDQAKAEPVGLFHSERGIVIQWRCFSEGECPACEGSGELSARGHDSCYYEWPAPA